MPDDPNWPRASAWLAGGHDPEPEASLTVLGAPVHRASITPARYDLAPGAIREALARFSPYDAEGDLDLRRVRVQDQADLSLEDAHPREALTPLAEAIGGTLPGTDAVLLLGGDNSITRPGVRGLGPDLGRVALVTLDAHHDLRDTSEGLSNGNPVRALLEDGLPGEHVAQIGIQPFANSAAYARVAREHGVRVVTASEVRRRGIDEVMSEALERLAAQVDAIYVDLDVDVLDRVYAPACPGSRPGGLLPWELTTAARLAGAHPKVRAADVVEVDPTRDVADATVLVAAQCVLAFAAGLLERAAR